MVYFIFTNSTISQSLIIYIHTYILYFIFLSPLLTNQRMPGPRLARHNLDYMQNYHNCPKGFFIVGFRLNNLSIQIPKGKWLPSESKKKNHRFSSVFSILVQYFSQGKPKNRFGFERIFRFSFRFLIQKPNRKS